MLKIISIILLSIMAGVFGRLGGDGAGRLYRLLGVPACCVAILLIMYHPSDWRYYGLLALTFGAILGVTSTYDKPKGASVLWFNWLIYGATEGIAFLPIIIYTHHWLGFLIRTVVCSGLLCLWDDVIGLDWLEEFGRYVIVAATSIIVILV